MVAEQFYYSVVKAMMLTADVGPLVTTVHYNTMRSALLVTLVWC